jgi:transposase-like protein
MHEEKNGYPPRIALSQEEVNMPRRAKRMEYTEKITCLQLIEDGQTDTQIAHQTGWSRWTIRKWRRIYQKQGKSGLACVMGRPKRGSLSTYSPELRTQLETMRRAHPGWGPITLLMEMTQPPILWEQALPSRARVAAFLKEKELVHSYQRRAGVPQPAPIPHLQPHDQWEMDAQGRQKVNGLGWVSVVNIMDVVSHLKVASYPYLWHSGPKMKDYQLALRCAFLQYGLPIQISLDHDSAFFDNTCTSPFPSLLHLWLVALGVDVRFIEKPPPLEHALIERNHQTMSAQAITGRSWEQLHALGVELAHRREFLNQVYPSRSLQYQAPLEAYPQASHSGRAYRPEWEEELLDMNRVKLLLAKGKWIRETNRYGEFFVSMQRYNASTAWKASLVELTFDPDTLEKVGSDCTKRFAIKRLTKVDLMGELSPLCGMSSYQLALPFSREDWRMTILAQLKGGTTS